MLRLSESQHGRLVEAMFIAASAVEDEDGKQVPVPVVSFNDIAWNMLGEILGQPVEVKEEQV